MVGRIIKNTDKLIAKKVLIAYCQASLCLIRIRSCRGIMKCMLSIMSNPWYTRRRKKGGKAFKKVEQVDGQEKAVYARVQGQSGPGKLSTRYDDRSSAQEVWGLQLHDSSLAAGVSNQSALALR